MKELMEKLVDGSTDLVIEIVVALVVLTIGLKLIKMIERLLKKEHKFSKVDPSIKSFLISFATISLKVMLLLIILHILGIPTASVITVFGSCALAIGLALQGGLSNIAGGIMLLIFKPFKIDDYIKVSSDEGFVKNISLFYTTINTYDNRVIQLPNGSLSNSNIINYTALDSRRVDIEINVSYSTKIEKVKELVEKVVENHELIIKDKPHTVRLEEMASSSLMFKLKVWTKTENYWDVYYDLQESIKEIFDKNKVEIPFNQLDVHINK